MTGVRLNRTSRKFFPESGTGAVRFHLDWYGGAALPRVGRAGEKAFPARGARERVLAVAAYWDMMGMQ